MLTILAIFHLEGFEVFHIKLPQGYEGRKIDERNVM